MRNNYIPLSDFESNIGSIYNLKKSVNSGIVSEELFENYLKSKHIFLSYKEIVNFSNLFNHYSNNDKSLFIKSMKCICFGYTIPQISKEFDTLQFFDNSIVNIELKSNKNEKSLDKIKKQLVENKYYLSALNTGKKLYFYTYDDFRKKLFHLDENDKLITIGYNEFLNEMYTSVFQSKNVCPDLDKLFDPSLYLVSPFNDTEKFIKHNYFLTDEQEKAKDCILDNNNLSFIQGRAGTGKSVLIYDIANELSRDGHEVTIIHCGKLNKGQDKINKLANYSVIPIKIFIENIDYYGMNHNQVLVFDECQRIFECFIQKILDFVKSNDSKFIFSGDGNQTLSDAEEASFKYIFNFVKDNNGYLKKLNGKIRTNKNVSEFIQLLFDKNKKISPESNFEHIDFNYFNNKEDAIKYIQSNNNYKFINYTKQNWGSNAYLDTSYETENSHEVIGQEWDNVEVAIDGNFSYDEKTGKLSHDHTYYNSTKMLFENITRARKNINIIIIQNPTVLSRIVDVINYNNKN